MTIKQLRLVRDEQIDGKPFAEGTVIGEMHGEVIVPTLDGVRRGHLEARLRRAIIVPIDPTAAVEAPAGEADEPQIDESPATDESAEEPKAPPADEDQPAESAEPPGRRSRRKR